MAQRRKAAADQARQQATGALIGGIGKIAGGVMAGFTADKALKGIGMDGLFGKGANTGSDNTASEVVNGAQALNDTTGKISRWQDHRSTLSQNAIDFLGDSTATIPLPDDQIEAINRQNELKAANEAAGFNINEYQNRVFIQNANGTFKWTGSQYEKIG